MRTTFAWLPWNIEGKARLYRCARKMSVMRLFSPDKVIDYSPALWYVHIYVLVATKYLRTSIKQTRNFCPTSISFLGKPPLLDSSKLERGSAQRRTKRKDCLRKVLRTYCRFMGRIRLISISPPLERYSQNMLLHISSFFRFSVSSCDVLTITGTTVYSRCSCLSCLNARLWTGDTFTE